jgi:purine-binding chemotaxis protein CheW
MTDTSASLRTHYLSVLLGDDLYALTLGAVKDIRGSGTVHPLRDVPAYVVGRLAHALGPMPLVDLRRRIGLPAQASAGPAVTVVLERSGQRLAVLADAVADVVDLGIADEPTAATEPDPRADLAWLKGVAAAGDRMALMLDPDQLIAPADRGAVAAAMAAAADTAQAA